MPQAPQATLMKTVIDGVLSGSLPVRGGGDGEVAAFSRSLKAIHFAAKDFAWLSRVPGIVFGIVIVLAVCALLYRAGRSGSAEIG